MPQQSADILVTGENLWFTERYLSVFDFVELFPADALSDDDQRGVPVRMQTDRGFVIETDIDRAKMQIRNRSKLHGWTRFTTEHGLRTGDRIRIEKTGERDFSLQLIREDAPV